MPAALIVVALASYRFIKNNRKGSHVIQAERARIQSTLTAEQRTFISILESHIHVAEPAPPQPFDPGTILFQTLTAGWHGNMIHDTDYPTHRNKATDSPRA